MAEEDPMSETVRIFRVRQKEQPPARELHELRDRSLEEGNHWTALSRGEPTHPHAVLVREGGILYIGHLVDAPADPGKLPQEWIDLPMNHPTY